MTGCSRTWWSSTNPAVPGRKLARAMPAQAPLWHPRMLRSVRRCRINRNMRIAMLRARRRSPRTQHRGPLQSRQRWFPAPPRVQRGGSQRSPLSREPLARPARSPRLPWGGRDGNGGGGGGSGGFGGGDGSGSAFAHVEYGRNPGPVYPVEARRRAQQGTVLLRVQVGIDGSVERVEIAQSSGFDMLDDSAVETVRRRWRFVPARRDGIAVESWCQVPIRFALTEASAD